MNRLTEEPVSPCRALVSSLLGPAIGSVALHRLKARLGLAILQILLFAVIVFSWIRVPQSPSFAPDGWGQFLLFIVIPAASIAYYVLWVKQAHRALTVCLHSPMDGGPAVAGAIGVHVVAYVMPLVFIGFGPLYLSGTINFPGAMHVGSHPLIQIGVTAVAVLLVVLFLSLALLASRRPISPWLLVGAFVGPLVGIAGAHWLMTGRYATAVVLSIVGWLCLWIVVLGHTLTDAPGSVVFGFGAYFAAVVYVFIWLEGAARAIWREGGSRATSPADAGPDEASPLSEGS